MTRAGRSRRGHAGPIANLVPSRSARASQWAAVTLAVTVFGVLVVLTCARKGRGLAGADVVLADWPNDLFTSVPFGVAGAVLLDRRPDLPFGWLLSAGCGLHVLGVVVNRSAGLAVLHGDTGLVARWAWCSAA